MADIEQSLQEIMRIPGALGAAVVDYSSGMTLGSAGNGHIDVELAAAGDTEVMRAKMAMMETLHLKETIEDILVTLTSQFHLIRPVSSAGGEGLFIYAAFDKDHSNLALARRGIHNVERTLEV
jgi:predicted regulator of Ras-like GTPase activity (Roadblock/LC7/MglB family)